MSKVKLMTQAEYAKHRGCSAVAVHKAINAGRISLIEGKIDPLVADTQWAANTRARAGQGIPSVDVPLANAEGSGDLRNNDQYMENRSRREAAEATISEMKVAEAQGKLVNKAEIEATLFTIARALRDGLTNCARRIASDVAPLTDAVECEAVIEREHRALLENMYHSCSANAKIDLNGDNR